MGQFLFVSVMGILTMTTFARLVKPDTNNMDTGDISDIGADMGRPLKKSKDQLSLESDSAIAFADCQPATDQECGSLIILKMGTRFGCHLQTAWIRVWKSFMLQLSADSP